LIANFLYNPADIAAVADAAVFGIPTPAQIKAAQDAGAWAGGNPYPETAKALDVLATRVAENREIAGIHYNMDSLAGAYAAALCLQQINARLAVNPFKDLFAGAQNELKERP
jgi:hypothetical protein